MNYRLLRKAAASPACLCGVRRRCHPAEVSLLPCPAALPGKGKHLFFFVCASLKILTLEERGEQGLESQEERQGKMLLHTEYSLLSLLHTQDGVVHHHGLFQVSGPHSFTLLGLW